jgi:hypothetical protein
VVFAIQKLDPEVFKGNELDEEVVKKLYEGGFDISEVKDGGLSLKA